MLKNNVQEEEQKSISIELYEAVELLQASIVRFQNAGSEVLYGEIDGKFCLVFEQVRMGEKGQIELVSSPHPVTPNSEQVTPIGVTKKRIGVT